MFATARYGLTRGKSQRRKPLIGLDRTHPSACRRGPGRGSRALPLDRISGVGSQVATQPALRGRPSDTGSLTRASGERDAGEDQGEAQDMVWLDGLAQQRGGEQRTEQRD